MGDRTVNKYDEVKVVRGVGAGWTRRENREEEEEEEG